MLKNKKPIGSSPGQKKLILDGLFHYDRRLRVSNERGIFTGQREYWPLQNIFCRHIIFLINIQWTAVVPKPLYLV